MRKSRVLQERKETDSNGKTRKSRIDIFLRPELIKMDLVHKGMERQRTPDTKSPNSLMEMCSINVNEMRRDALDHKGMMCEEWVGKYKNHSSEVRIIFIKVVFGTLKFC